MYVWVKTRHSYVVNTEVENRDNENIIPDSKVHGANMGPTWGRKDPGGPHVLHMNLAMGDVLCWHSTKLIIINFPRILQAVVIRGHTLFISTF